MECSRHWLLGCAADHAAPYPSHPTPHGTPLPTPHTPHLTPHGPPPTATHQATRPYPITALSRERPHAPLLLCAACAAAGICYRVASHVMVEHLSVDDPLDAFAIHGVNGAWGVLASAIFSAEHYARQVRGARVARGVACNVHGLTGAHSASSSAPQPPPTLTRPRRRPSNAACGSQVTNDPGRSGGLLYGGGRLLGASVAQVVCTVVWSGALSTAMFASLRRLGVLRVPTTTGVDVRAAADDGGRDWDGAKLKAREPYVEATDPPVEPRSATAPIP